jgi:hypothetical protein
MTKKTALLNILALLALSATAAAQNTGTTGPPAPPTMSRHALEEELTHLRAIVGGGAVRPQRPPACVQPEQRQFDFWVGEWDVSPTGSPVIVAESSITLADEDCVVIENWRPFRNGSAHSISMYDAQTRHWRQFYAGAAVPLATYTGNLDSEGVLRFDVDNSAPRTRMNYQRIDANTIRQWGEQFNETTREWSTQWDLTYRRRGAEAR